MRIAACALVAGLLALAAGAVGSPAASTTDLTGANFNGANLGYANFIGATFPAAAQAGAIFCHTWMPDGSTYTPNDPC